MAKGIFPDREPLENQRRTPKWWSVFLEILVGLTMDTTAMD